MEYLRDGSGNEGEGGAVTVKSCDEERGSPTTLQAGSRVIQAQGKFDSNMVVKNLESLVSKTKISQNP